MFLEEKLEEAQTMYSKIGSLLFTMPLDDAQPIEEELDLRDICDELDKTRVQVRELSIKMDKINRELNTSHREMMGRLPVQRLLVRDRSYIPVLAPLMDTIPEDEDHPDIVWICKWITHPDNSLEEATYFCIHAVRAAAEGLAILCHLLNDQWEQLAWDLIPLFEALFKRCNKSGGSEIEFGSVSNRFNTWIICVVGDPEMCPNPNLRLKMMLLYRLLKIDDDNYKEALESVFSAFSSLNRNQESNMGVSTKDIYECLNFFEVHSEVNKLYKFGNQLTEKLRHNRNIRKQILIQDISFEYAMGLKTLVEPREIIGLTEYLKYISDETDIQYKAFQDDPNTIIHTEKIDKSLRLLDDIMCNFKDALEGPEMLSVIAECVMNITHNAIRIKFKQFQDGNENNYYLQVLNLILMDEAINSDHGGRPGLIGQEIIRRYKERICRWRLEIPKLFMEGEVNDRLIAIIYNDKC